jgi:hypothetical protein
MTSVLSVAGEGLVGVAGREQRLAVRAADDQVRDQQAELELDPVARSAAVAARDVQRDRVRREPPVVVPVLQLVEREPLAVRLDLER